MPKPATSQATAFNEAYPIIGEYATDDSRIPYYNPADSEVDILPGEPVVVSWNGTRRVFMAQNLIRPGESGYLLRRFTADFPCDFSANVVLGASVMWDIDEDQVSLAADVTNGFVIGNISYSIPTGKEAPAVDSNDRVICGTTATSKCRVISIDDETTVKGTVPLL